MREHELKCWPEFFEEVAAGRKTFEIRENDRTFAVGDVLRLCEYRPQYGTYTGRQVLKRVSYVTDFQQRSGFVVLGLHDLASPSDPVLPPPTVRVPEIDHPTLCYAGNPEYPDYCDRPKGHEGRHSWDASSPVLPSVLSALKEWQPIETAPKKDSTRVDLWAKAWLPAFDRFEYRRFADCVWMAGDQMTNRPPYWLNLDRGWHPTHWMPLPEPPAALTAADAYQQQNGEKDSSRMDSTRPDEQHIDAGKD